MPKWEAHREATLAAMRLMVVEPAVVAEEIHKLATLLGVVLAGGDADGSRGHAAGGS